ncbi:MAG TPA: peptidoglycan-binding protein [Candidatus Paceibacterota bacterium]|nr:peptidoglycan-binding protein [Candidatus Paceibacterota bacterium]
MAIQNKNLGTQVTTVGLMAAMLLVGAGVAGVPAGASAQAQATASVAFTFTRDLTVGSVGADVTALQTLLINKGFAIPAGATGYFGAQTQAALARYQAANGIAPAAGYFGPITRAHVAVNVGVTPTPSNPGNQDDDELEGNEARLSNFDLTREDSSGNEGEEEVEIATAEFDVDGGDIRIERMEIRVEGENTALNMQPWRYFDRIAVYADGDEIAEMDVDSRSDWSRSGDAYDLTLTGLDHVVREGDAAELTIVADISDNIDNANLAQTFEFSIEDRGIRAVDAERIQQYVGDDGDTVSFGFGAEENGDLRISANSDNPDASILVADEDRESEDYEVLVFDLENRDDVDSLLTDLTISVSSMNSGVAATDIIREATLEIDGDDFRGDVGASTIEFEDLDFEIGGDDEVSASLFVTLVRNATSTPVVFSLENANVDAEGVRSGNTATVSGSASSETHTIALTGVAVEAVSTSQSVVTPGSDASATYGTYTIRFDVTALEEDAYIATTTGTSGTVGVTYTIGGTTFTGSESAIITSTADRENGFYVVQEGETETFTLTVTLNPDAAGTFDVRLDTIRFNDSASFTGSTTYSVGSHSDFRTDPIYIAN